MIDHTGIGVADVARAAVFYRAVRPCVLFLKSETFAGDADDERVVEDAIGHRHGEHAVASEGAVLPKPHQL